MTSPKNTKYAPQLAIVLFDPCVVMASRLSSPNFETRSTPKCASSSKFGFEQNHIAKSWNRLFFVVQKWWYNGTPFLVHNFFSCASPNRLEPCTDTAFSGTFRISHQCRWSLKCQKSHFFGGVDYQRVLACTRCALRGPRPKVWVVR